MTKKKTIDDVPNFSVFNFTFNPETLYYKVDETRYCTVDDMQHLFSGRISYLEDFEKYFYLEISDIVRKCEVA